jgi:DNA-binding transcriptional regulator YbjK
VIITAACRVAKDKGLAHVNHGSVAKRCTVETSVHTVRHYFDTQRDLWSAVIEAVPGQYDEQGRELGL